MIHRRLVLGCMVLPLLAATSRAETYDVAGAKLRIELRPDWPAAMVGEPLYLSLTIENLGSEDVWYGDGFTQNPLGRPDFVSLEVKREDGTVLPIVDPGPGFGGAYGGRRLRPGERQTKRLFLPHWATIETPGRYTVTCRRAYDLYAPPPSDAKRPTPRSKLPVAVSTVITIDPHDPAKIPAVLDRWREPLRGPDTDAASEATRALSVVTDPRVIPLLQQGIASGYYEIMLPCIAAHGKFDDDLALGGLNMAMRLEASDLKDTTNAELAGQLLSNLRGCAAGTLMRSRHPDAPACLRAFEDDVDWTVRLQVVHASGRRGDPEDRALLERRAKADANEAVRREAARYLAALRK